MRYSGKQSLILGIVLVCAIVLALWNLRGPLDWIKPINNLLIGALAGLLANLLVGFWQSNESGNELRKEVSVVTSTLHKATENLLEKTGQNIKGLADGTKQLIRQVSDKINEFGTDVQQRHEKLETTSYHIADQVSIMIDAYRKPLLGFPAIFDQVEKMIVEPKTEPSMLRILSFTPCFGLIHSYNKCLYKQFYELLHDGETWNDSKTEDFKRELLYHIDKIKTKIEATASSFDAMFQLATFDCKDVKEKFLEPLAEKTPDICQLIANDSMLVDKVSRNHEAFLRDIKNKIASHSDLYRDSAPELKQLNYLSEFPLQMIIAQHGNKKGCLVFFIGTLTLAQKLPPSGFYTQNQSLIELFESVFDSIVQTNKNRNPAEPST